jgi:hypothetical protein
MKSRRLRFPTTNAQIPVVGSNNHLALIHSGVFNMPCRPRGRVPPEAFRDCLPAAAGHAAACKEMRRHPHEWPEKQPGVKKKENSFGLNPILRRFAAEVGVTNVASLSVEPGSRTQAIAIGHSLSYHPL